MQDSCHLAFATKCLGFAKPPEKSVSDFGTFQGHSDKTHRGR